MENAVGTYGTVRQELHGAEGCGHTELSIPNKLEASIWYCKWRDSTSSCFEFSDLPKLGLSFWFSSVRMRSGARCVVLKAHSHFCSTTIQYVIYIYMKHLGVRGKEQRNLESKRVRINFLPKIKVCLRCFFSLSPAGFQVVRVFGVAGLTWRVFLVWIFAEEQQIGERSRRKAEEASI